MAKNYKRQKKKFEDSLCQNKEILKWIKMAKLREMIQFETFEQNFNKFRHWVI